MSPGHQSLYLAKTDFPAFKQAWIDHSARCMDMFKYDLPISHLIRRGCAGCTICCTAPAITPDQLNDPAELALVPLKPAGEKCKHCKSGAGRAVYDQRPGICRGYLCLWASGVPVAWPEITGMCWTLQPDLMTGGVLAVGHCNDAEAAARDVDIRREIEFFLRCPDVMPTPLAAVVLRSPLSVIRYDAQGIFPNMIADIYQTDPLKMEINEDTQRLTNWNPKT
jgi:hypothetical protein